MVLFLGEVPVFVFMFHVFAWKSCNKGWSPAGRAFRQRLGQHTLKPRPGMSSWRFRGSARRSQSSSALRGPSRFALLRTTLLSIWSLSLKTNPATQTPVSPKTTQFPPFFPPPTNAEEQSHRQGESAGDREDAHLGGSIQGSHRTCLRLGKAEPLWGGLQRGRLGLLCVFFEKGPGSLKEPKDLGLGIG